jgi:hypothetical protein
MKIKLLVLAALVLALMSPGSVQASGPITINGRWAGTAFANAAIDFNGDGVAARSFDLKTYDEIPFSAMEGIVDTALVSIGTCAGPASLELKPFGKFTFRGRLGDGLYAEVDPAAPNLCFDPANPNEILTIRFVGGTGIYQNATGTGTLTLHDFVRHDTPVMIPGVPFPVPAPLMIDTRGEFTLHVNL